MNTSELMAKFCGNQYSDREWLIAPIRDHGFLWATNAEILVCVPDDPNVSANDGCPANLIKFHEWFKLAGNFNKINAEAIPKAKRCPSCNGSGIWPAFGDDPEETCQECNGSGEYKNQEVSVGAQHISRWYLALIASLENAQLSCSSDAPTAPMFFKFEGGWGCVMPIKQRSKS